MNSSITIITIIIDWLVGLTLPNVSAAPMTVIALWTDGKKHDS